MKLATILFITLLSITTFAATHTISFGGGVGFTYSPASLTVAVGDVIRWEGDFSFHPLSSNAIPSGAAPFSTSAGTSFEYTVTEAGTYGYHCTAHGAPGTGMHGEFTAIAASVPNTALGGAELMQNFPNPAGNSTTISFRLEKSEDIQLQVFDLQGNEIATLASGSWTAGDHVLPLNTAPLAAGMYFYRLTINGKAITKEMIVTQ